MGSIKFMPTTLHPHLQLRRLLCNLGLLLEVYHQGRRKNGDKQHGSFVILTLWYNLLLLFIYVILEFRYNSYFLI